MKLTLTLALLLGGLIALPASSLADNDKGAEVYEQTCRTCHGTGNLGAPRVDDGKRWKKLIKEGLDDLVPAALRGVRRMPARGGNPALSDEDVALAVIYMANRNGAAFGAPSAADLARWQRLAERKQHAGQRVGK